MPAVARPDRDLLGAVGMPVEPRLADQELDPPPEPPRWPPRPPPAPPPGCPAGVRAALPTPVGARYSPKTARITAPHSPVVAPAFAAATDAGITLRPSAAAARSAASAAATAAPSRAARQAASRATCSASTRRVDHQDAAVAGGQRRGLAPR